MVISESLARVLEFLPVVRDIVGHAEPTVAGRERAMGQLRVRVFEHPKYQRLTRQAQAFLGGYLHRLLEEQFGPSDE